MPFRGRSFALKLLGSMIGSLAISCSIGSFIMRGRRSLVGLRMGSQQLPGHARQVVVCAVGRVTNSAHCVRGGPGLFVPDLLALFGASSLPQSRRSDAHPN